MLNQKIDRIEWGVFMLRLTFGSVLLGHGMLKLMVFTLLGTVVFFESLGLPGEFAYLVVFGEIMGGVAVLSGVYTRLVALLSLPIMLGAVWVHSDNGWVFSNEGGGWEFPALLAVLSMVVFLVGSGPFAVRSYSFIDKFIPNFVKG